MDAKKFNEVRTFVKSGECFKNPNYFKNKFKKDKKLYRELENRTNINLFSKIEECFDVEET